MTHTMLHAMLVRVEQLMPGSVRTTKAALADERCAPDAAYFLRAKTDSVKAKNQHMRDEVKQ